MYHIKEDKRARASAALAVDALDECLTAHGFGELTITELCRVSTLGRATFYRLFDDLQDVVAYKCELFAKAFQGEMADGDIKTLQLRFFRKWMENIDLLRLIVSLRRIDILIDCHRRHLEAIRPFFEMSGMKHMISDYHVMMLTNILVGSLLIWCEHGCVETAEELIGNTKEAIEDIGLIFG